MSRVFAWRKKKSKKNAETSLLIRMLYIIEALLAQWWLGPQLTGHGANWSGGWKITS
jgi:hypothetical protein